MTQPGSYFPVLRLIYTQLNKAIASALMGLNLNSKGATRNRNLFEKRQIIK